MCDKVNVQQVRATQLLSDDDADLVHFVDLTS